VKMAAAAAIVVAAAAVAYWAGGAAVPRAPERVTRAATTPVATAPVERPHAAATGGVSILPSTARARSVVAGTVMHPEPVDDHAWKAGLRVDRVLLGPAALGDTLTIAWEELSQGRAVRFTGGERVLVVLEPLPTQSLWRRRFPLRDGAGVSVVAARGEAFLRAPDAVTLDGLQHYLALAPAARDGDPGTLRLAELVAGAHPAVAHEALTILEQQPARVAVLGAAGAASLLRTAQDVGRDGRLRARALRLAFDQRLAGSRETARALAESDPVLRADAYRALAALPDGLGPDTVAMLLEDPTPELRIVAVEAGGAHAGRARLVELMRNDASPAVRLAAGRALLAHHGSAGITDAAVLLDDPNAGVRTGIAETIGRIGAPAVAPLHAVVDGPSERAALAAVIGLSHAGEEGGEALETIEKTHRQESIRAFAGLALGRGPDTHEH
jgi:hypothetical protein